ncbi:MFS general substrate transporter [Pholiota conissans]|uniref:MFS general substrate transporter n=1 Tax=Pholiota conissans TaxID=109636 RepID=A0A9P6D1D1_9AGAR|nr:MFS general substrate transporter [Pholiota conissans]
MSEINNAQVSSSSFTVPSTPTITLSNTDGTNDPYLVDRFDSDDPDNPQSNARRWYLTLLRSMLVLNAPILWGPLSERYGRRPVFIYPFFVFGCFLAGGALARNTISVLLLRFLSGVFAAAPLTNSGTLISDIWDARMRGKALAIFTVAPFAGPALGPIVGGFIGDSVSWRWLFWVLTAIVGDNCEFIFLLRSINSYTGSGKAQARRLETGDNRYYARLERQEITFMARLEHILARPFVILFREPMLVALTLYMSFVYGCLYLLFTAYPIVFTQGHHFNSGISGLMFLPLPLGGAIAVVLYSLYYNPKYEKEAVRVSPKPVPPEFRLEMMLYGGPFFASSYFWFAWTSFPKILYWAPMMSGLLMGFSIQLISVSGTNKCVSIGIGPTPLLAPKLYNVLGPQWAASLVGFIAITMIPIPFVLKRYGRILRKRSRFCPYKKTKNIHKNL